jgi:flagellar hook-length control protein FliK
MENPSGPALSNPDGEPTSIPNPPPPFPAPLLEGQAQAPGDPQIQGEKPLSLPFPVPSAEKEISSASSILSRREEQGGQSGGIDPKQNFIPEVKPQAEKGNIAPEARPGKNSSDSFSIADVQATSRIAGKMNQERTEKFDPTAPKEEAPGLPKAQDPVSGKGVAVKENEGQAPTPEPPAGEKLPVREEAQIPPPLSKDPASSHMAREFPTTSQEEKEGLPLPGTRHGQVPPSGKESQTLLGLYRASAESAAGPLGGAEKMAGGREAPAPMRLESQGIYQQVGERVLWLIRNQEERIRMSLDPPELGHLCLEIHRTKENIQTTLYTDNPVTKVTLESSQREIQRIIESEGFKLEKFDVLVQQDLSHFQERKDSPFHSDSRSSFTSGNIEAPVASAPDSFSPVPRRMHSGSQYLDLFV